MKKLGLSWVLWTLLSSSVITGVVYKFAPFNIINFPISAGHIEVVPWQFELITWLLLLFITLLSIEVRNGFTDLVNARMLLVCNSLLLLLSLYSVYALVALESLTTFLKTGEEQLIDYLHLDVILCLAAILFLSTGEFFLIRRMFQRSQQE